MSAPVLWILTPLLVGGMLVILRRFHRLVWITGTTTAFFLALAASFIEIGPVVELGPISFELEESFQILGRQFIFSSQDSQVLSLLFLLAAVWFLLTPLVQPGPLFIPVGLIISGIIMAALTVDPFLYAALFIEMIVLISIPLLVPSGKKAGRGVLRFLTYETIGVPFILYSDWMLAGSEGSPGDFDLVLRAAVLLGIGFAFFLAIFPFHSWMPMLFEEAHPYVVAFVAVFLFLVVTLFGLELFNRFVWLRNSESLFSILRFSGLIMVFVGGIWAGYSSHLGRALGFAIMTVIGLILVALSLGLEQGVNLFFDLVRTSTLAILVWSGSLYLISNRRKSMNLSDLRGAGRTSPVLAGGLTLACLTIAGYPVLAGYPAMAALLSELAPAGAFVVAGVMIGLAGVGAHGVRALREFVSLTEDPDQDFGGAPEEDDLPLTHWILLVVGIALMILIGVL